jgi:hypothetical protein
VEAYCCPCPANKLRVSSLRWPPQDEQPKKAQGEKKTKNKSGWGLSKMSPNCRQKSFSVYFEIPNVTSSRLPKKDLKSFDEQTRANKCTRKEEKEPPAESIYAHVYSITSNGIKEKEKKQEKSRKNR